MSIAFLLVASRFLRVKGHSLTKKLGNSLEILGFFFDNPSFPCCPGFPWKLRSKLPSFPKKSLDISGQNYTSMKSKFFWISWNISKKSLDFCSFSELFENPWISRIPWKFSKKIRSFPRNF